MRPAVRDALHARALRLRADTAWFRAARYGVMVHWTSDSMPLAGAPRAYAAAVDAFDADAFADTMARTGAGFVVFTTSHARMFFPAPLAALDAVLPGRTAQRDLVADLAAAHDRRDTPFTPPRWTDQELADLLRDFAAHGNVPILNLEIAQGGEVSAEVVETLGRAGRAAR